MDETTTGPAEIHLIVAEGAAASTRGERAADKGGETQSLRSLREFFGSVPHSAPELKAQLERTLNEINAILEVTSKAQFPKMEFESMEVGIAISAKGSIGIVTAGVDASLKLKFKKA